MSVQPEVADLVRQWMQKADNDLRTAQGTLFFPDNCPYDTVCFHAQQCVEKCLKAALVCVQAPFRKTHDLEELFLMLPSSLVLPASPGELARLTPHATNSRYPDDWRPIEREEAEWAVGMAGRVAEAVRSWLSERITLQRP